MIGLLANTVRADVGDSYLFDRMSAGIKILNAQHTVRYKTDDMTAEKYYLTYTALQVHSDDFPSENLNVYRLVRSGPGEDARVLSVKKTSNTRNGGLGGGPGDDGSVENGRIDTLASFEHVDVLVHVSRAVRRTSPYLFLAYVHMGLPDGSESIINLAAGHDTVRSSGDAIQAEVYGDVVYVHSGTLLFVMDTLIRSTDTALTPAMFNASNSRKVLNVMASGTACSSDVECTETADTSTWMISEFVLSRTNAV